MSLSQPGLRPDDPRLPLLPPREETVVRLRLGCHDAEPMTLAAISRLLGLSRKHWLRVYRRALKRLRQMAVA